jgi:acetyl-CoA/propionyl-CoA carboxylase, biotin carboxylase, biotin carboxyl carrier protein
MHYRYQIRGQVSDIQLERLEGGYRAVLDGTTYYFTVLESSPGELTLLFEGHPVRLHWAAAGDKKWIALDGCTYLVEHPSRLPQRRPGEKSAEYFLRAPMPAQVRAIFATEGDLVEKGQPLVLLEAMKMEMRLTAPAAGRLARVLVSPGDTVLREQVLLELDHEG